MHDTKETLYVRLSIDAAIIRIESNPLARLNVSTRALLLRHILALGSQFQSELLCALDGKYDVKFCTRISSPGAVDVVIGDETETFGVQ